jgi:hypothetical protein
LAKRNPVLDAFERKKEQEFAMRRKAHEEIRILALIIAADDNLDADEDQIGKLLDGYLKTKEILARDMLEDIKADKEMVYTRFDLARRVKQSLGKNNWMKYRELLPLLEEFREWEE